MSDGGSTSGGGNGGGNGGGDGGDGMRGGSRPPPPNPFPTFAIVLVVLLGVLIIVVIVGVVIFVRRRKKTSDTVTESSKLKDDNQVKKNDAAAQTYKKSPIKGKKMKPPAPLKSIIRECEDDMRRSSDVPDALHSYDNNVAGLQRPSKDQARLKSQNPRSKGGGRQGQNPRNKSRAQTYKNHIDRTDGPDEGRRPGDKDFEDGYIDMTLNNEGYIDMTANNRDVRRGNPPMAPDDDYLEPVPYEPHKYTSLDEGTMNRTGR